MAAVLVFTVVKGVQKYQLKRSTGSEDRLPRSKRNRKSITSLVIPTVTSAHFPVIDEKEDDKRQDGKREDDSSSLYESERASECLPKYTAPIPPYTIHAPLRAPPVPPNDADPNLLGYEEKCFEYASKYTIPSRAPPPPPVMLGLDLCESPSTPPTELSGNASSYFNSIPRIELPGDSPADKSSEIFELDDNSDLSEPLSPAPLLVVKGLSSPQLPDLTFSSDESEDDVEQHTRNKDEISHLEVPDLAEYLDLEPPPIPPKSPARKLRPVSYRADSSL